MNKPQNNINTNNEEQYIKDMKYNTLLFEEKLQKLKKKAKELQIKNMETNKYKKNKPLNHNSAKKDVMKEKYKTIEVNNKSKKIIKTENNYKILKSVKKVNKKKKINNKSRNESIDIISSINQENSINNNDTNASIKNIYNTIDDTLFNDNIITKDYKIKELIKKNKQLQNEIEYKNNIIESLEKENKQLKDIKDNNENICKNKMDRQNKIIDEINCELGKLTREIEEKNQKIDKYEINNKNLQVKIDNLIMQNKTLSNREKKITDENEYLERNMDKIKDENENYKNKIIQLEALNQNLIKDYDELNNKFLILKKQKEQTESYSEEQKMKILNLKNELKAMNNLLEEPINQKKRNKKHNNNDIKNGDEIDNFNNFRRKRNINLKLIHHNYQNNIGNENPNDNIDYDNYDDNLYNKKMHTNPSKTSFQFYKIKREQFNDEYYNNDNYYSARNRKFYNKIKNTNFNSVNANENEDRFNEIMGDLHSNLKGKKNRNTSSYDIYNHENNENGLENDYLNHNFSSRNIFNRNNLIKRKLGYINNDNPSREKLNGNQINAPITNEYNDYDEIDELNNDLNVLLKNKNIMENNLLNLHGHSKTINNILKKKELNEKIIQTENKINEIRVRLKKLKGL